MHSCISNLTSRWTIIQKFHSSKLEKRGTFPVYTSFLITRARNIQVKSIRKPWCLYHMAQNHESSMLIVTTRRSLFSSGNFDLIFSTANFHCFWSNLIHVAGTSNFQFLKKTWVRSPNFQRKRILGWKGRSKMMVEFKYFRPGRYFRPT